MRIVDVRPDESEAAAIARHERGGELIYDMPRAQYDRLARVNWSTLKHMGRSPAHYQEELLRGAPDTDARRLGRCRHLAILEPERFRHQVAVWDGKVRRGKEWDAFRAENRGLEILRPEEFEHCIAIQKAVRANPVAAEYLARAPAEVTLLWTHVAQAVGALAGYRIECKGRPDIAQARAIVDFKSTRDASPDGFGRECWRYRYDAQGAFYVDGYEAVTGQRLPYVLIAAENTPPYVVQVYTVPDVVLELGREHYRGLLDRLALCRAENRWPGYLDGESELMLPRWSGLDTDGEDVSDMGINFGSDAQEGS